MLTVLALARSYISKQESVYIHVLYVLMHTKIHCYTESHVHVLVTESPHESLSDGVDLLLGEQVGADLMEEGSCRGLYDHRCDEIDMHGS